MNSQEPVINKLPSTLGLNLSADPEPVSNAPFHRTDPRNITVGRIVGLIVAAVMSCSAAIGLVVLWAVLGMGLVWGGVAILALLLVLFLFWIAWVWPVWEFQRTFWRLDETGLQIHRGVVWRHKISIPVARVQHADVSQGPLQRKYELGKLTVHTAGTQNASVELDGITHVDAIQLRDKIVSQRKVSDVV